LAIDAIGAKRAVILAAEAKIDHFAKLMQENPRLARLYQYWMQWYIVRRADWIVTIAKDSPIYAGKEMLLCDYHKKELALKFTSVKKLHNIDLQVFGGCAGHIDLSKLQDIEEEGSV